MDSETNQPYQSTLSYNKEQINLIKNTVAKGATEDEIKIFLYLAQQYNLDPFKKEIWFTKYGSQTNIMTSRDGYLKYAHTSPEFGGLISFVVHEGDNFEVDAAEYKITHKFGTKRGKILGAWARCDRKGKRPFISYVSFEEYNQNTPIWRKYPSAMIQKVAEVFVLKRAFGINGLVTNEEMNDEPSSHKESIQSTKAPMMEKEQKSTIWELAQSKGMTIDSLKQYTIKEFDTPLTYLTYEQAEQLLNKLSKDIILKDEKDNVNNGNLTIEENEALNTIAPTE
ncbi:phage recombination protein Bet [Clostridium sp. DJ247]|uniref:phage recombination protein Bet n=1 Tax=Clostridium sp. DJ247 TaxID=2726188 RepID=UPI0016295C7B|nr:phage recombination protein Bet [Clostridium sp. DJ247]MBC2581650.1 phage recombination protein Bet [Clostridium sp. DJ247]